MTKEFIPYEQTLAFKELGFDEPCFGYYDNTGKLFFNTNGQPVGKDWVWEGNQIVPTDMVLAPTFSQAFRFFREEYGIDSYIRPNLIIDTPKTYQFNVEDNTNDFWFETYPEAEIECLNKLIEIVKGGEQ